MDPLLNGGLLPEDYLGIWEKWKTNSNGMKGQKVL